ncbi:MAG: hypothetical protein J3T61_00265 [Candidatus Brocadiales bacterium]|nr:hypothetical protein [Candidatus Bathyanammoxibius sp.]
MRSFAVVTSFSAKQWEDDLTRECVRTMATLWSCEKMVYVNGGECGVRDYAVTTYNLDIDASLWAFKQAYQNVTKPIMWPNGVYDYRFDACKFAHKVYALYRAGRESNADTIIWLDADVVTTREITNVFLTQTIPEDCIAAYLGREEQYTSECGFVGYNSRRFLQAFRSMYVSGDIFKLAEWHDSFVFDHLRTHWNHGRYFHNINQMKIKGKHVWPLTLLGAHMSHLKGPARKEHHQDFTDAELAAVTETEGMRVVKKAI